MRYLNPRLR